MDNNLGNVADNDGSDDEGLTVPDIASLTFNLYWWYLIFVLFNLFYSSPNSSDDPIYARSRTVKLKHSWQQSASHLAKVQQALILCVNALTAQ